MRWFTVLAIVLLLMTAGVFTSKTLNVPTKAAATVANPQSAATINAYDLHLKTDIQALPVQDNEDPI